MELSFQCTAPNNQCPYTNTHQNKCIDGETLTICDFLTGEKKP